MIRATLKNNEKHIIDMTGAQFHWPETVTPWNEYRDSKVLSTEAILSFGDTVAHCKEMAEISSGYTSWPYQAGKVVTKDMGEAIDLWQKLNMRLVTMLKLPDKDYVAKRKALLDFTENFLQHRKFLDVRDGLHDSNGEVRWGDVRDACKQKFELITKGEAPAHSSALAI